MSTSCPWLSIASALLVGLLLAYGFKFQASPKLPLPPGPTGGWFYGAKKLLPLKEPWKTYLSWSKEHNTSIISFRIYNRIIIVLNDAKAVSDLLERKSIIYSDRPTQYMSHIVCGRSKTVFNISSEDPHHKIYRRLIQQGLGPGMMKTLSPILEEELRKLLDNVSRSPKEFVQHVRRNFVGAVMRVTYGYTINDLNDTFVDVAEETVKITDQTMANGSWLVDYYPIFRHVPSFLPGGGFKRQGKVWRERLSYLSDVPHHWVKRQMASGSYSESFTSRFLTREGTEIDKEQEDIIRWCAGGLYVGASDTTVSAVTSFILLMALYPEVQTRAQAEIDEICGHYQVPQISQLGLLTYLQAVFKEVLRYAPVGNLALPHKVIADDEYKGYRIPKDATVIGNVWAILHDPLLFPNPGVFRPERFTGNDGIQPDPCRWAFGFGRRVCPGTYLAETSVLLVMAGLLSQLRVSLPPSTNNTDEPVVSFTTGITSHIELFDINITLRSKTEKV